MKKKEDIYKRTVWYAVRDDLYVPRCSKCGKYRKADMLKHHWFFNGVYCIACIQDILWDNCRTISEVSK